MNATTIHIIEQLKYSLLMLSPGNYVEYKVNSNDKDPKFKEQKHFC